MAFALIRRAIAPAPAAATRRIEWLESDTCPGELDTAESAYQRDLESNGWTGTDFAIVVVAFVLFVILVAHFATQIARAIPN